MNGARGHGRGRALLAGLWLVSLLAGLACAWLFVAGLLRDAHFEQAELPLDLGRDGPWRGTAFRIWGGGSYALWLATLGPQPPYGEEDASATDTEATGTATPAPVPDATATAALEPEARFSGEIEVQVLDPSQEVVFQSSYDGAELEHASSGGMTWSRLDGLTLEDLPIRTWRLEGRVIRADPAFADGPELRTRLLLRRDRPDVGMGGLINYVMIIPAGVLLLLSLGVALALVRSGGSPAPAWISGLLLAALAGAFAL